MKKWNKIDQNMMSVYRLAEEYRDVEVNWYAFNGGGGGEVPKWGIQIPQDYFLFL